MRDRSAKWRRRSITAPPQPHVKPPPRAAMGPDPLRSPPAERERGSAALPPASGAGDQLPELIESFFIESFFIESFFIESFFIESFFIESFFIESCFIESCFIESCFMESCFIESCFIESCFMESRFMESCFIDSFDMALLELAAIALWAKAALAARPQVRAASSSVARRVFMGSP